MPEKDSWANAETVRRKDRGPEGNCDELGTWQEHTYRDGQADDLQSLWSETGVA